MRWDNAAKAEVRRISASFSNDLTVEAERIAKRPQANGVTAAYVQTASDHLYLNSRTPALDDVLLTLATTAFGIAVGIFASMAMGSQPDGLWVVILAIVLAIVSAGVIGVAAARKLAG